MKKGAYAEALIPSFPSKTFPNHYSIVTGLYPGNHGLVDNTFYDPKRDELYEMKNRKRATDPYYFGGTPLWQLARKQGLSPLLFFGLALKYRNQTFDLTTIFPTTSLFPIPNEFSR